MKINFWPIAIIAVVVFLFFFFRGCQKEKESEGADTTTTVTIVYDSTIYIHSSDTVYLLKETLVMQPVQDTVQLIRDYFTQREFSDSIVDSNIAATYSGMVWKNSLFNPKLSYRLLKPQTIITNTVIKPTEARNKAFFGGYAKLRGDGGFSAGGLISLQNKRDAILTIGYGYPKQYTVGYQVKISFKKR